MQKGQEVGVAVRTHVRCSGTDHAMAGHAGRAGGGRLGVAHACALQRGATYAGGQKMGPAPPLDLRSLFRRMITFTSQPRIIS